MTAERPTRVGVADRSSAAVRRWVAWYTRGLPADLRAARRDEIEADLWDEGLAAVALGMVDSIDRQRLGRLVRGIPADLAWRLERRGGSRKGRKEAMRISRLELVLLLGLGALCATGLIGALLTIANPDPGRWAGWGPYGLAVSLGLSVLGLLVAIPRPAAGLVLAMAGTMLAMAAMPWAFYILLPVPLVAWFRYLRSRPADTGKSPAADGTSPAA